MNAKKQIKWIRFDEIASTNDYAKEKRAEKEDLIVTASSQSGGRGTKGRSFSSEKGGVYLSKLTFYEELLAKESFRVMTDAAVSVCKTLTFFGLNPVIKWPNDVFVNGKKICGILIENTFSGDRIVNSVVGIGLNVCNALPEELKEIATTIKAETGQEISAEQVEAKLVEQLLSAHTMAEYRSFIGFLGTDVVLILNDERIPATLLSVDDTGGLWARIKGEERRFSAAEVSVRL